MLLGIRLCITRGSHLYIACWSVCDRNQNFWLEKYAWFFPSEAINCLIFMGWRLNWSRTFLILWLLQFESYLDPLIGSLKGLWSFDLMLLHGTYEWLPIICLTPSMWKVRSDEMVKHGWDTAVLFSTYLIHGSASEVNRSGADAQVVSCHRYYVVFVEQLAKCLVYQLYCACIIWLCTVVAQSWDHNYIALSRGWNTVWGFWEWASQSRDCTNSQIAQSISTNQQKLP